jgi:hypothetical protein
MYSLEEQEEVEKQQRDNSDKTSSTAAEGKESGDKENLSKKDTETVYTQEE